MCNANSRCNRVSGPLLARKLTERQLEATVDQQSIPRRIFGTDHLAASHLELRIQTDPLAGTVLTIVDQMGKNKTEIIVVRSRTDQLDLDCVQRVNQD